VATTFISLRRVFSLIVALTAGLSPAVYGAPVELSDSRLESVTAGSAEVSSPNGGLIVGNTSTALVRNFAEIQLAGEAQKNAKSLNLVNSSDTRIANGVNLWIVNPAADTQNPIAGFSQMNTFEQHRRISIKAGEWIYEGENVTETSIESSSATFIGGFFPETVTFTGTALRGELDPDTGAVIGELEPANPKPTEELKIGIGIAFAGEVSGEIGDTHIKFSSKDRTVVATESEVSITVFGIKIVLSEDKSTQVVESELVKDVIIEGITIDKAKGVGCIIVRGFCNIDEGSNFSVTSINTRKVFTPGLPAPDTSAEMIVMGEGGLDLQDDYFVSLTHNAQQNSSAFNLVNGAGGILANGANLSNSTLFGMGGSGPFRQTNSIFQKR